MAEKFRFRAFISYSHRDERWAKWLHGALESYRLPRRLVGKPGAVEPVPQYFAPVFRDRDELPTSPDLSEQVRQALTDSGALIVICSPAASESRWVNEEIRRFRALGRADRIFCLIVDGDPDAENAAERCFPPALFEANNGERHEPLAADARRWADGKTLAKLKLIAGILGVRLDALRQREAQRRRRRKLGLSLAGAAAVTLTLVTVWSALEERRQRSIAEQWITRTVTISKTIESTANVETLELVASEIYEGLEDLDPNSLSPNQRLQSAKVLRQLGNAYFKKREMADALLAFQTSRDMLVTLSEDNPDDLELLFEAGLAEYYLAITHREMQEGLDAREAMARYSAAMTQVAGLEPENLVYAVERAAGQFNLGILDYESVSGDTTDAVTAFEQAIRYFEEVLERAPENQAVQAEIPEAYAWLADAQLAVCSLGEAVKSRFRAADLSRKLFEADPGNRDFELKYAYRLMGLATIYRILGSVDQAIEQYERANEEFARLSAFDRANVEYQWGGLLARGGAAELRGMTSSLDSPLTEMLRVRDAMAAILESESGLSSRQESDYAIYLTRLASTAATEGEDRLASESIDEAIRILERQAAQNPDSRTAQRRLLFGQFQRWEMTGALSPEFEKQLYDRPRGSSEATGCEVAAVNVLAAILRDDRASAGRHTELLLEQGYSEPNFIRFCRRYELCPGR